MMFENIKKIKTRKFLNLKKMNFSNPSSKNNNNNAISNNENVDIAEARETLDSEFSYFFSDKRIFCSFI